MQGVRRGSLKRCWECLSQALLGAESTMGSTEKASKGCMVDNYVFGAVRIWRAISQSYLSFPLASKVFTMLVMLNISTRTFSQPYLYVEASRIQTIREYSKSLSYLISILS
ncbi:hypothetical protein NPIL_21131 [Nephila pilipes]|uniref:Uncharacterized protein n=1 Tax=Nephila pilipes TaxID=299642 RepID=A0A8X6UUI5_NEPPI|nr:hypothetical protein NPIL_21131 [Nephila pilipes]